jgi:hypothetical protein
VQRDRNVPGDMGGGVGETTRIAGQHDGFGAQAQLVVGPQEALQHPPAEEACAAGHEQPTAAQLMPEALGVLQDVVQVPLRQRPGATPRHRF